MQETHVPIGISLSLPNLPELNPIPTGAPGSIWGTGLKAPLREKKSRVKKRVADLELERKLGEQAEEDRRWGEVEETGKVAICIKIDEFRIQNEEFCSNNDGFCIKNDALNANIKVVVTIVSENDELCIENEECF